MIILGASEVRTQPSPAEPRRQAGAWRCCAQVLFQLEPEQSCFQPQPPLSATAVFVNKETGEES